MLTGGKKHIPILLGFLIFLFSNSHYVLISKAYGIVIDLKTLRAKKEKVEKKESEKEKQKKKRKEETKMRDIVKGKHDEIGLKKFDINIFKLENGIDVIFIPKKDGSGVSALFVWVKSGAADEPPKFFGGAHILEHIVFKGSPERGVSEVSDAIERVGGYINAWTSYDNTVYWTIIPTEHIDIPIEVLGDIIWNPKFTKEEFEREKEVVLEEWRRGQDIPSYRISHIFFEKMYGNHPYGHPVIGYEETIRKIDENLVLSFHSRFYSPDNVFVVVSGDFDEKKVREKIEKVFGRVKKTEKMQKPDISASPNFNPDVFVITGKEKEAILLMGFLGYPYSLTVSAYLDLVSEILEKRLYERLRLESMLANSIDVDYWSPIGIGSLSIYATAKGENIPVVFDIILQEIRKIRSFGFSEKELSAAKRILEADIYRSFQSARSIASIFGRAYQLTSDPSSVYDYLKLLKNAFPADLAELANDLFDERKILVGMYLNEQEAKYADEVSDKVKNKKVYLTETIPLPFTFIKKSEDGSSKYLAKNGVRVILKKISGTGTISVYSIFPAGQALYDKLGIPLFSAKMLTRGTKNRTAQMILDEMTEIGGSIGADVGFDSLSVYASFLAQDSERGLDIFFDIIENPSFKSEEMEKVREDILEDLRTRYDVPRTQAFDEFYKLLFAGTPYSSPEMASSDTIREIKRDDLISFWDFALSDPSKIVIAVVGDFTSDEIMLRQLHFYGEKFFTREKKREVEFPRNFECSDRGDRERLVIRDGNQVHIIVGFCGPSLKDNDSIPMQVLSSAISGMGGRLFMNLREQRGLAYVVGPVHGTYLGAGFFGGYIASAPEKLTESLSGLKSELLELKSITEQEILRGKNQVVGSIKRNLQSNSSWASSLASYEYLGFGFDYIPKFISQVQSLNKEDIVLVVEKYIRQDKMFTLILGPDDSQKR